MGSGARPNETAASWTKSRQPPSRGFFRGQRHIVATSRHMASGSRSQSPNQQRCPTGRSSRSAPSVYQLAAVTSAVSLRSSILARSASLYVPSTRGVDSFFLLCILAVMAGTKAFTTGQVASICDVAPRTVSTWVDTGILKGYRLPGSRHRRIPRDALIAFVQAHTMDEIAVPLSPATASTSNRRWTRLPAQPP